MKRLIITILGILLLMSIAIADQTCYVNEPCNFQTNVLNTTEQYYEGTVTNSLKNITGSYLYEDVVMTSIGEGNYVYSYTFNNSGTYVRKSFVLDNKKDEQITVKDISEGTLAGLIISNWFWLIIVLMVLICIGTYMLFKKDKL